MNQSSKNLKISKSKNQPLSLYRVLMAALLAVTLTIRGVKGGFLWAWDIRPIELGGVYN